MFRLTVKTDEYLMINDNIKIVFLGGTPNHLRIMIDAPKDVNIVRSSVIENSATEEEKAKLSKYYAEQEHPEKYKKKKNVVITNGNTKSKYGQVVHTK